MLSSHRRGQMSNQAGFSLIELLAAVVLMGILVTLGATAFRQFWLVRALSSSQSEIVSQLNRQQQRVVSETHPLVYGVRFPQGSAAERTQYGLIRFNADANGDGVFGDAVCGEIETISLGPGIRIQPDDTDFDDDGNEVEDILDVCTNASTRWNNDDFVFFFARGHATGGGVEIRQTILDGLRTRSVCVNGLTARVEATEENGSC